jgi:magnesium transporter
MPAHMLDNRSANDNRSFKDFNDNRSFKDLELPLPGIMEASRNSSEVISLSSSGSSSRSASPEGPRGEDFAVRHPHRYHRHHRRSTAHRRRTSGTGGFSGTPVRRPSERDRRPTGTDRRSRDFEGRTRSGTVSSIAVDDDEVLSHVDSNDDPEKAEEDVCFPMQDDDIRDRRGIDFEEMEEFAREMRELLGSMDLTDEQRYVAQSRMINPPIRRNRSGSRVSTFDEKKEISSALQHHPAFNPRTVESGSSNDSVEEEKEKVKAQAARLPRLSRVPTMTSILRDTQSHRNCRGDRKHDRFTFFTPRKEETISAEEFCDLVEPGETYAELFDLDKGTWWLDVLNPTVEEMKMLSKAFNIHPLTNEDIRTRESREKVELFRTYYFVCFQSFESDADSVDYLEAANMYIVVFRSGLLTFHFTNTPHAANVRRRIRQLRDYVSVSSDWICYALIDDITDAFGPLVHMVEGETEAIDDDVMVARDNETREMLTRISVLRKKIMGMLRLLGGKADVIKMFAKRCNEHWDVAPTGEIGLYLGDIQGIS